jgi:hypothetical protein
MATSFTKDIAQAIGVNLDNCDLQYYDIVKNQVDYTTEKYSMVYENILSSIVSAGISKIPADIYIKCVREMLSDGVVNWGRIYSCLALLKYCEINQDIYIFFGETFDSIIREKLGGWEKCEFVNYPTRKKFCIVM